MTQPPTQPPPPPPYPYGAYRYRHRRRPTQWRSRRWSVGGVRSAGHRLRSSSLSQIKRTGEEGPRSGDRRSGDRLSGDGAHGLSPWSSSVVFSTLVIRGSGLRRRERLADGPHHRGAGRRRGCRRSSRRRTSARTAATRPRHPGRQAGHPAATGAVPSDPGGGAGHHDHQRRNDRPATRQRQGAVHGQQLRQPGPAGILRRHPCHRLTARRVGCAAVRRPPAPAPVAPGSGSPTVPDQPVPSVRSEPETGAELSAGHAGDGQCRPGHQRQPVLHRLPRLTATHLRCSGGSTTGLATVDKIAAAASAGTPRTVGPASR